MGSSQTDPESFESIVLAAVDLMSKVSEKATKDLKEHLPDKDTIGRARTSAGNVKDSAESLLRLTALGGQLLVDAAARLTQDVAVPFLENRSPVSAPETSDLSSRRLSVTAAPGGSGSAPLCVYNKGRGAARSLQFSATRLCRFGEAGAGIPGEHVTFRPSQPSRPLDRSTWADVKVEVTVPAGTEEGEYLGVLCVTDESGSPASAGHLALRVTVVHESGNSVAAGPGAAGPVADHRV